MKMNTKSRLAIAAIIDVATHETRRPVALIGVGRRQDISLSYLEQLFRRLREQGFVHSMRGPGGGYRLSRSLADITVADVIAAVDDESSERCSCKEHDSSPVCQSNGLWCGINRHLHEYLSTITLESIRAGSAAALAKTAGPMPALAPTPDAQRAMAT